MPRLTVFDELRRCYTISPDAQMGKNIQKLGMYEDRDEAKIAVITGSKKEGFDIKCPECGNTLAKSGYVVPDNLNFCFNCGQRVDWREAH